MTPPPALQLEDVSASYGSFRALFHVNLTVENGSAVALIGANGAGKSTVARVASGLIRPSSGRLLISGSDFTGSAPHQIARAGVALANEGRSLFASLTVQENLSLAFRNAPSVTDPDSAMNSAFALFPQLEERCTQQAGTLSGGEQRILTLARVMATKPQLLIADELSLGLAPLVTTQVYEALATIRDSGCALLIVEQHLDHALALADEVVAIEKGEITFQGDPADVGEVAGGLLLPSGHPASGDKPT